MTFPQQFTLDPQLTYLNTGTHSLLPNRIREALQREELLYERNPTRGIFTTWERLWNTQKRIAEFFHANPHDLFFRHNVTHAMNSFVLGIPIKGSGEILTSDLEYGAIVNLCRFRAERDGLKLRTFQLPDSAASAPTNENELADYIIQQLRPDTKMLMLSHVMTGTGLTLPLKKIANTTRERGVLFVVDGAHGPGSMPIRFDELSDLDFYGSNFHKWMLGPKGTGFGWMNPKHRETLQPTEAGWTTYEVPIPFKKFGEEDPLTARLLMSSCFHFALFHALNDLVDFWNEIGAENIFKTLHSIQNSANELITKELGWERIWPGQGSLSGPVFSYRLPKKLSALGFELMHTLERDYGVQVASPALKGETVLRVSPHIYNRVEDIQKLVSALKQISEKK